MRSRVQGLKKEGEEVAIVEKKKKSNNRVFLFFFKIVITIILTHRQMSANGGGEEKCVEASGDKGIQRRYIRYTYIYIYTPYFLLAKYSIRATKKSDKG